MMIVTKTPYRISFFGGGTDLKEWYQENEGHILSTSINKYCNVVIRNLEPVIPYNFRIVWRESEETDNVNKIKNPIAREAIKLFGLTNRISMYHEGDLPGNSGIASSSAFACGVVKALKFLNNEEISKKDLAKQAILIEREILKEAGGVQDQIASSFGGFNYIKINKSGDFDVAPVKVSSETLQTLRSHLLFVFTGIQRNSFEYSTSKQDNIKNKSQDLHEMAKMPLIALKMIEDKNFEDFGRLLHEAWLLKKGLASKVSNGVVDYIYTKAMASGALGGKLLGAGGGGFMILFAKPEYHAEIKNSLSEFIFVDFEFENKGCHLINT